MTRVFRVAAILLAIGGVIDPAFAVRRHTPLPVDVRMPPAGEPGFAAAAVKRDEVLAALGETVTVEGGESPQAVIAIGNASLSTVPDVPLFAVALPAAPSLAPISAPSAQAFWGQQVLVAPVFRARQLRGRTTTFRLLTSAGTTLASATHQWTSDDERFAPSLSFAPAAAGQAVVRVVGETDDGMPAAVDVAVSVTARRARVLVFEPRPSWSVAFARQALEMDPLFEVSAIARTSRGIMTRTAGAPEQLTTADPDAADVMVVGGLDVLATADVDALGRFVAERGGTLILVPDTRIPESIRRAFELPQTEETLLERPAELRSGALVVRASEVLRADTRNPPGQAIVATPFGRGQILLSTGLDAWRYRGDAGERFAAFWQALAADAAAAALPPVAVRLDPAVARPGDVVQLVVRARAIPAGGALPRAAASVVNGDGAEQKIRLWPGNAANEYLATFRAPAAGRYDVRVDVEGVSRHDVVLSVDADAARPAVDRSQALAFAARATGGASAGTDIAALVKSVRALPAATDTREVRPARTPWWMAAFAACACAEWAVRRRRGQR